MVLVVSRLQKSLEIWKKHVTLHPEFTLFIMTKRTIISKLILLPHLILMLYISMAAQSLFALSGTNNNYEINTPQDLAEFARMVNKGNIIANATLNHDIDYRGYEEMIGCDTAYYCGTFDGACHKILIRFESDKDELALFRYVGKGGMVNNLHVEGSISAHSRLAGGIIATLANGSVSNCFCHVNIHTDYPGDDASYGGIVGVAKGHVNINNSTYFGQIHTPEGRGIGGFVGWVESPMILIRNCVSACRREPEAGEGSNPVARTADLNTILCQNVYYRDDVDDNIQGSESIRPEEWDNGAIFYKIYGTEFYSESYRSSLKSSIYQNTLAYIGLGFITIIMVAAVLIVVLYYYKERQRTYKTLYERAVKTHETWLNEQKRIFSEERMPFPDQSDGLHNAEPVTETQPQPDIQTDAPVEPEADREETIPGPEPTSEPSLPTAEDTDRVQYNLKSLYARLLIKMEQEQLYKDPDLDEPAVASAMCSNKSYISECISKYSDQPNFNKWLAFYRINHAIMLIEDNPDIDVKTLYVESGFNNHTSFTRHFKNIVGMTAMQYIKMRKENIQATL